MCLRLYLNGDGTGRGTHLSLFFVVMRGKCDALLKWPFSQKVGIILILIVLILVFVLLRSAWMTAGLSCLTWPESDRLDPGAGWGCTALTHALCNQSKASSNTSAEIS